MIKTSLKTLRWQADFWGEERLKRYIADIEIELRKARDRLRECEQLGLRTDSAAHDESVCRADLERYRWQLADLRRRKKEKRA